MCVHYCRQIDFARADLLFQYWCHPMIPGQYLRSRLGDVYVLVRIGRVYDHGVFGFIVNYQVGVVVTTSRPFPSLAKNQLG